jgi:hypothetical protein
MATMLRPAPAVPPLLLGLCLAMLGAPTAQAQTEPPAVDQEPPPAALAPPPAPAPAAPAATPPGNAGLTPTPGAPIGPPPGPAAPPVLAAPAQAVTNPGELAPLPPPGDRQPIYRETWFWAVVGVVVLTATMITIGVASQGPSTPTTDLGNMRAY